MAVGHERAQAEFFGQSESLAVVSFGLIALRGLTLSVELAENPQGPSLGAPLTVLAWRNSPNSARRSAWSHSRASMILA